MAKAARIPQELLFIRAEGARESLAFLRQVEDGRIRMAFSAVRALDSDRAFPFAREIGAGLGRNRRRERGDSECERDEYLRWKRPTSAPRLE
jgi:hypothetical protein